MAPETVTITIRSSSGEDGPLTVNDAMRQILDFFDLLTAAGGDEGSSVTWQLVDLSMKSPVRATAQAVSNVPGIPADPIARREKDAVAHFIKDAAVSKNVPSWPSWMDSSARERATTLFERNANGIGRTDIKFYDDAPLTIIDQRLARVVVSSLATLTVIEGFQPHDDLSRIEFGSVEVNVLMTGPFRGQPAIRVRERLSGSEFWCVFSPELAEREGPQHSWAETWTNRRVIMTGRIAYSKDGRIQHVYAFNMEDIDPRPLDYKDIADPHFTGGLSPSKYIDSLWDE